MSCPPVRLAQFEQKKKINLVQLAQKKKINMWVIASCPPLKSLKRRWPGKLRSRPVRTGDANTCAAYCSICVRPATTIYVSPYCQYAAGPSRPESLLSAPIKALFRLNEGSSCSIKALLRLYSCSIQALLRLYYGSIKAHAVPSSALRLLPRARCAPAEC